MKILFLTIALSGITFAGHAQLGNLKGKVTGGIKENVKSKTSAPPSSAPSNQRTDMAPAGVSGEPTSQEKLKSPAKEPIRQIDMIIMKAEDALKKNSCDGIYIESMAEYIDDIKRLDPSFKGLPKYEKDYKKYMDACSEEFTELRYKKHFESLSRDAGFFEASKQDYLSYTDSTPFVRKQYLAKKEAYTKESKQTPKVLEYIAEIDAVYANKVPEIIPHIRQFTRPLLRSAVYYSPAGRAKSTFMDDFSATFDPESTARSMGIYSKHCEKALLLMPGNAALLALKDSLDRLAPELVTYSKSGQFEKDKAKREQLYADAVKCPKSLNNDAALMAIVKRDFNTEEYGTLQRISITDTEYHVKKNSLDIPVHKVMVVYFVRTSGGKCFLTEGLILCEYTGGGTYAKPRFEVSPHTSQEMNCANTQK